MNVEMSSLERHDQYGDVCVITSAGANLLRTLKQDFDTCTVLSLTGFTVAQTN